MTLAIPVADASILASPLSLLSRTDLVEDTAPPDPVDVKMDILYLCQLTNVSFPPCGLVDFITFLLRLWVRDRIKPSREARSTLTAAAGTGT